jgi:hypothetical protein
MRVLNGALLVFVLVITAAAAQTPDTLLSEKRLTVHTLLREDVFAGFISDNATRLARAEQNITLLLKERPDQRANLIAWRSGAALYRAVAAHEAGDVSRFREYYQTARDGFAEAATLSSGNDGVAAITGGSFAVFADRLPAEDREAAWEAAWKNYSILWKQQQDGIEGMPLHFKGEVLAGLAQSAQRTGRTSEAAEFLDRMLTLLANTSYEPLAKKWKADPASAATTNLTCQNCHAPGRLSAKLAALTR